MKALIVFVLLLSMNVNASQVDAVAALKSTTFKFSVGTGFYLRTASGHRYIITNQHVCEDGSVGGIVKQNETVDLCAVYTSAEGPALVLAPYSEDNEEVYSCSATVPAPRFSHGYLKDKFDWTSDVPSKCPRGLTGKCYRNYTSVFTNLYSVPGSSGSPVVDISGKLVGVVSSYDKADEYSAGVVTYADLKAFVEGL